MGTKVAVVLAILTIGYLEIKLYTILPNYFFNDYCLYIIKWWKRFIDDCFILWKKSENLQLFEELLNTLHLLIKFTKEEGDANIPFLDILVIKTDQGTIETDIFHKKTNAHRYLVFESSHSHKTKRNIPYTLAKRITRIVSNEECQQERILELSQFPKHCNYPEGLINVNIQRAKKPTTPNENIMEMEQDTLSFITTYCQSLSFDEHHIRQRLEGEKTDRLKRALKDTKLVSGQRQPMNLNRLLTSSAFSSLSAEHHTRGMTHCKNKKCQLCRQGFLKVTDQVNLPVGRLLFKIKHEFSCKSTNILYYMTCTICGKDYVGQTKDFRKRTNNHKFDIRGTPNEKTLSIDKHIHHCQLEKYQTFLDPIFT